MKKSSIQIYLSALVWCLVSLYATAQFKEGPTFELTKNPSKYQEYHVIPLLNEGAIVVVENDHDLGEKNDFWEFYSLDTLLQTKWKANAEVDRFLEIKSTFKNEHYAFWLFNEPRSKQIAILRLSLFDGETEWFKAEMPNMMEISGFVVLDNKAFLAGNDNDKPVLVSFSFFDKSFAYPSGFYDNHFVINSIAADVQENQLVVILQENRGRSCNLVVKRLSYDNKLLETRTFSNDLTNENYYGLGVYAHFPNHKKWLVGGVSTSCKNQESKGVFVKELDTSLTPIDHLIPYDALPNFFNFMSSKRQERVKERTESRKEKGKPTKIDYYTLLHKPLPNDKGGFWLVAEMYYYSPKYNVNEVNSAFVQKIGTTTLDYHFSHVLVMELDSTGKVLWENSLKVDDVVTIGTTEIIQIAKRSSDELGVAYINDGRIYFQRIKAGKYLDNSILYEVLDNQTGKVQENVPFKGFTNHSYLVWAERTIPSKLPNTANINLFYIKKLSY
jgi:hypothetical protein